MLYQNINNKYIPVIYNNKLAKYISIDISIGYLKRLYKIHNRKENSCKRKHVKKRYKDIFPVGVQVYSSLISNDLIPIKPMGLSSNDIFFIDYIGKISDKEITDKEKDIIDKFKNFFNNI